MDRKTNFTSNELLNKKFPKMKNGYDPMEVDSVLDQIIQDYELFETNPNPVSSDTQKLLKEIEDLKRANEELKEELDNEKNKWKYVSKDHKNIHIDNYELLQRIGRLEMVIHEKLNMDPNKIR